MVERTDNEVAAGHQDPDERTAPPRRKPVSFDFKLRLTSTGDTGTGGTGGTSADGERSAPSVREVGVEVEPLDAETLIGLRPDEPRQYQTDGDLQSLIVELANQIADPDTSSTPVVRVTASATIEKSRPSAKKDPASGTRSDGPAAPPTRSAPVTSPTPSSLSSPSSPTLPTMSAVPAVPALAPLPLAGAPAAPPSGVAAAAAAALRAAEGATGRLGSEADGGDRAPSPPVTDAPARGDLPRLAAPITSASAGLAPLGSTGTPESPTAGPAGPGRQGSSMGRGAVAAAAAAAVASTADAGNADASTADASTQQASVPEPASEPAPDPAPASTRDAIAETVGRPAAAPAGATLELAPDHRADDAIAPSNVSSADDAALAAAAAAAIGAARRVTGASIDPSPRPAAAGSVPIVADELAAPEVVPAEAVAQTVAPEPTGAEVIADVALPAAAAPVAAPAVAAPPAESPIPGAPSLPARATTPDPAPAAPASTAPAMLSNQASMAAAAAPAPATGGPAVPPLNLARIERRPNAERPTQAVDFQSLLSQAGIHPAIKRKKKRHPFRVLFKLLFVVALVGGGLYAGKTFVLDKRWDAELKPFAEAVSNERELQWKKAVPVEVLPADEYATRLATSWLGVDEAAADELFAEWRAMGIDELDGDLTSIGAAAMAARPAFYDPAAGTVYELEDTPDELRELALDRALTAALLDQHDGWSDGLGEANWDVRIARQALVDGDAGSTARAIVGDDDEIVAQIVELATEYGDDAAGAPRMAADLVGAGGGLQYLFDAVDGADRNEWHDAELVTDAGVFDGLRDLDVEPSFDQAPAGGTRGLLYWYYALAGRLEPADAWRAALAWDGDQVSAQQVDGRVCVDAIVNLTGQADALPGLLGLYQQWGALAPVEAGTTVTVTGPSQVTISSCDPGTSADAVARDAIAPLGQSIEEHEVVGAAGAVDQDQRACVVNAVRAYGLVDLVRGARGTAADSAERTALTDATNAVGDACVG